MCVVSMVMDHYWDKWQPYIAPLENKPNWTPPIAPVDPKEIEEFRKLLERAREYDRKNNEPDCELAEKRQKLLDLAKQLGVEIKFL
jgi:hypothetical protein